jgi:hypothetical protein
MLIFLFFLRNDSNFSDCLKTFKREFVSCESKNLKTNRNPRLTKLVYLNTARSFKQTKIHKKTIHFHAVNDLNSISSFF